MRLDGWLRQDHSLGERLRVLESLCQAVNAVHDQGQALAALEPSRIEVGSDGSCDVSAARKGSPSAEYLAPDRQESGQSSTIADVYAAGVIAWELLVGRTPGPSPTHVAEVRPEVPREVADAVMACLERTPDWRPKDLTYLAQIAAAKQPAAGRAASAPPARASRPPRASGRGAARESDDRPARRTWPLLAALVIVLALAGFAWWQYMGPGAGAPAPGRVPPPVAPTPVTVADATPAPEPVATPAPPATAPPVPVSTPEPVAAAGPVATPMPTVAPPRATPTPVPTPTPTPRPPTLSTGEAADAPPAAAVTPVADIPPVAPPAVPAELTAVSPLTVSRGGKALLDVRGTSLRTTHRVQIVPLKKASAGITVVRQKLVSDVLITVLLDLAPNVSPGEYGVVVEEPQVGRSNTLIFTVAK